MKTPRGHLVNSPDPLTEGSTVIANCGAEVPNARFVVEIVDGTQTVAAAVTFLLCRACCRAPRLLTRYEYAVITGQEALVA